MTFDEVERAFASWARELGLAQDEDEAFYHGQIDGHGVRVDDGVRASGCYGIEVWVTVQTSEPRGVLKRGVHEATPLRAALHEVLEEEDALVRVRVDEHEIALTFREGTRPRDVERILEHVIAACRAVPPNGGVYR